MDSGDETRTFDYMSKIYILLKGECIRFHSGNVQVLYIKQNGIIFATELHCPQY